MSLPAGPADSAVTLARIEVKLDTALRAIEDHEGRLRRLEERRVPRQTVNTWIAACSSVAAVAAAFIAVIR